MIKSNLPPFIINRTCAVTGHRKLPPRFNEDNLRKSLEKIIDDGYDVFLIGMAVGFDLLCFKTLLSLKERGKEVKIGAVVPCADQSKRFSEEDKNLYDYCLKKADYIAAEENTYFKNCMLIRDNYLVLNSSLLFAFFDGRTQGGTYYTINKALKNGLKVIYFET